MAVFKRPNSKFYWMKFYFNGELIQKSTQLTNKSDADTFERAYRTKLVMGEIGIETKKKSFPNFDEVVTDFLKFAKVKYDLHLATYRRHFYSCESLKNHFGKVKINKITKEDVENFIVQRLKQTSRKTKKKVTRLTVNHELLVLKMIFNRLVETKVLRENPVRFVKRLADNEKEFHVITTKEEKAYILAAPQPLQDVFALLLDTGLRTAECYNLRCNDVNLEQGYLQVKQSKTHSGIRRVYLTEKAKSILQARKNRFKGDYLFPMGERDGEKPTYSLNCLHRPVIERLGFKFRLYDCRHTFASRMVENGCDLVVLASILGHANLKMVMRYAHPSETLKAEAVKQMENSKLPHKRKAM